MTSDMPDWHRAVAEFEHWRVSAGRPVPDNTITEQERKECREIGRRIGRSLREAFEEQRRQGWR